MYTDRRLHFAGDAASDNWAISHEEEFRKLRDKSKTGVDKMMLHQRLPPAADNTVRGVVQRMKKTIVESDPTGRITKCV